MIIYVPVIIKNYHDYKIHFLKRYIRIVIDLKNRDHLSNFNIFSRTHTFTILYFACIYKILL